MGVGMAARRGETAAVLLGCGIAVAIAFLDVLTRGASGVFTGLVAVGPFVTAVLAGPAATGLVAVVVLLLALALGVVNGVFGTAGHGFEIAVVTVAGLLSVWLTRQRLQAQRSLTTMRTIAATVQRAIVPSIPSSVGPMRFAARYESATAEALVGGDFYEVADTPYGVRAIVGDVCGKGLPAAHLANKAGGSFSMAAQLQPDLAAVVKAMEMSLEPHIGDEEFITAALVEFGPGPGTVTVANCGHHPPLRLTGGVDYLQSSEENLPLGFGDEPAGEQFPLPPGSRLLLYTDGLVEARNRRGEMLPLSEVGVQALAGADLEQALDDLLAALRHHTGGTLHDDVALLLAEPGGA